MNSSSKMLSKQTLSDKQIRELVERLEYAESALAAIRQGSVDAISVEGPEGTQTYTRAGAIDLYRTFVETMSEGAAVIDRKGSFSYINWSLSALLHAPIEKVLTLTVFDFCSKDSINELSRMLRQAAGGIAKGEIAMKAANSRPILAHVAMARLAGDPSPGISMIVSDLTQIRERDKELADSEKQLRYLSSQLLVAQEQERKRIAREIHDSIGQALAGIKIRAQNTLRRIEEGRPRTPETSLETMIPLIQQSIEEVRRIQMDLRPSMLDDLGVIAAIEWLIRNVQQSYPGIKIVKDISLQEYDIPDGLKTTVFRITQEAMNNIGKHARADLVTISLRKRKGSIELEVQDNGQGFDVTEAFAAAGFEEKLGLTSMRERAQLSGGTLSITSTHGKGTNVSATWPL